MQLFFCSNIEEVNYLDEQESFHAAKVLRHTAGDHINIVDGRGNLYSAQITSVSVKKVLFAKLKLIQPTENPLFYIHMAVAPVKSSDRNEWFVEKAVELGVDEITFLRCHRSEKKGINLERANKVAISAMKQSSKSMLPKINAEASFQKLVESTFHGQKFIPNLESENREHLINVAALNLNYLVVIGPEGDFTSQEIDMAKKQGFVAVTLGQSRLRTETAAIAACHILNLIHEQKNN